MIQTAHFQIKEFVYSNLIEREAHTEMLTEHGWTLIHTGRRLKKNIFQINPQPSDYEWTAQVRKDH